MNRILSEIANAAVITAMVFLLAALFCWERLTKDEPITEDTMP